MRTKRQCWDRVDDLWAECDGQAVVVLAAQPRAGRGKSNRQPGEVGVSRRGCEVNLAREAEASEVDAAATGRDRPNDDEVDS